MKWMAVASTLLLLSVCSANERTIRKTVDEDFLKDNPEHISVQTIAKGNTLCPFIFFSEKFLKGHEKTWAKIKSPSGELILAVPVSYTKTKDGKSSVLVFQFSTKSISLESKLELTIVRDIKMIYTIPLRLFAAKGVIAAGKKAGVAAP